MTDTPRSIRMNKEHRADMLGAVMKQWAVTNPAPVGATFESLIEGLLTSLMKVPAKAPSEMKALKNLCNRTEKAKKYIADIPADLKDVVSLNTEYDFQVFVRLEDSSVAHTYVFRLPRILADKLKIPYIGTQKSYRNTGNYPSYFEQNTTEVEFVSLLNAANYNTLTMQVDSPEFKAYKQGKRALNLWENDRSKVAVEIQDYLAQFTTTGQVRELWPEMEQYLPAHIADPARVIKLPALTRSRLNERLGI